MRAHLARVAGVVLAAGSSVRFGRNKLLLELGGEALVRRAARTAADAGLDPVIVVIGHEAEQVRAALAGLAVTVVVNRDHAGGAGTSLRAGVRSAAEASAEALVLTLADMPLVTDRMILSLLRRAAETSADLVVSRYGAIQAPPTLFGRALFHELLGTADEGAAKSVVGRHLDKAESLVWPEGALQDVDVASDFLALSSRLATPESG